MRKYYIVLTLILGVTSVGPILALTGNELRQEVIFSEMLMGGSTSAGEEFIELYNTTDRTIDLNLWEVQYATAASQDWSKPTRSIKLQGTILAHDYYLLASTDYLGGTPQAIFSATLAQSGGHLRIVQMNSDNQLVHDLLGWGTAAMPLGVAAPAPPAGVSLVRGNTTDGQYVPSSNNSMDYQVNQPAEEAPGGGTEEDTDTSTDPAIPEVDSQNPETATPPPSANYALEIAELLPNPGSPANDSTDEYVEIYNPTGLAIDLSGYKLVAGLNDTYKHTLTGVSVNAGQYLAVYSRDTKLTLSNTSGRVRLLGPDNTLVDETGIYEKAADNYAWIYGEGRWQWTTQPTPGSANALVKPAVTANTKTATTKNTTKSSKAKTSKAKTASAKTTRASTAKNTAGSTAEALKAADERGSIHGPLLAGVASLAVLYALYEYRHDLANRFHEYRSNRAARRAARSGS